MRVRGAPAIAIGRCGRWARRGCAHASSKHTGVSLAFTAAACTRTAPTPPSGPVGVLSLRVELHHRTDAFEDAAGFAKFVGDKLAYLVTARPTAVNMAEAANRLTAQVTALAGESGATVDSVQAELIKLTEAFLEKDIADNRAIGKYGADAILAGKPEGAKVSVLTHCNTGSLATAGYGTALGVIRSLHERGQLEHAYCTETRPYNQGCRLTAYELVYEEIPATLVCDSMVAALMKDRKIDAVVVGADRVVANGDTANKIGTYQISVVASHHNVPFYVAVRPPACILSTDLLCIHRETFPCLHRPSRVLAEHPTQRVCLVRRRRRLRLTLA